MKVLICYLLSSHTTTQNQGVWFSPHHGNSSNVHTLTLIQRTQAEASRKQQPMAWPSAPKHHELRSLHSLWRGCVWEMSNRNRPCLFHENNHSRGISLLPVCIVNDIERRSHEIYDPEGPCSVFWWERAIDSTTVFIILLNRQKLGPPEFRPCGRLEKCCLLICVYRHGQGRKINRRCIQSTLSPRRRFKGSVIDWPCLLGCVCAGAVSSTAILCPEEKLAADTLATSSEIRHCCHRGIRQCGEKQCWGDRNCGKQTHTVPVLDTNTCSVC